ncbi:MAG: flagellar hook-length control protein FliK [Pseudomonadota bacterium]
MHVLFNTPKVDPERPELQDDAKADVKDQTQGGPFVSVFEGDAEDLVFSLEQEGAQPESFPVFEKRMVLGGFHQLINQSTEADADFPENTAVNQQIVPEVEQLVALMGGREATPQTDGFIPADPKSLDRTANESSSLPQAFTEEAVTPPAPAENGSSETKESLEVTAVRAVQTTAGAGPDMLGRENSGQNVIITPVQSVDLESVEEADKPSHGLPSLIGAVVSSQGAVAPVVLPGAEVPQKTDLPNAPRLAGEASVEQAISKMESGTVQPAPEPIPDKGETLIRAEKTAATEEQRNLRVAREAVSVEVKSTPALSGLLQQSVERIDVSDRFSREARSKFTRSVDRQDRGRDDVQLRGELPQRVEMSAPLKTAEAVLSEQGRSVPVLKVLPLTDQSVLREAVREDVSFGATTAGGAEPTSTTVASARAQPEPVNARAIVTQVIQSITRTPGENSIEIRLQPEELGRVRLMLLPVEGGVSVQIAAERADTLELLKRNVEMLEADLRKQGFSNASFSFESGNSDEDSRPEAWSKDPAEKEASSKTQVEVGTRPVLKEAGRLDIRV